MYTIEFDTGQSNKNQRLIENKEFINNLQTAILLSLLEKGQLNLWQFNLCKEKIDAQ